MLIKKHNQNDFIEKEVICAFIENHKRYGSRRIKVFLNKKNLIVSRRKVGQIFRKYKLFSTYTKKRKWSLTKKDFNYYLNSPNLINHQFNHWKPRELILSDCTYLKIKNETFVCSLFVDAFNREILSYGIDKTANSKMIFSSMEKLQIDKTKMKIFHTDRGSEFNNHLIKNWLLENDVKKSSSRPGRPSDNAVVETINKTIKTEFFNQKKWKNIQDFEIEFEKYITWYNEVRIHSYLGYYSPLEFKKLFENIHI